MEDRDRQIIAQLQQQQSIAISVLLAIAVSSGGFYILIQTIPTDTPLGLLMLPALAAALAVRTLGRPYSMGGRLLPSLCAGAVTGAGLYLALGDMGKAFFVASLSCILCAMFCRRSLSIEAMAALNQDQLASAERP